MHHLDRLAMSIEEFQKVHPIDQEKPLELQKWWEKVRIDVSQI
jgi:hypothetical protein